MPRCGPSTTAPPAQPRQASTSRCRSDGTEMSIDTAARSAFKRTTDGDVAAVPPAARLRGRIRVPGDKSISHRALLLAALSSGESIIEGAGDGADIRSTAGLIAALGVSVERLGETESDHDMDSVARLTVGYRV